MGPPGESPSFLRAVVRSCKASGKSDGISRSSPIVLCCGRIAGSPGAVFGLPASLGLVDLGVMYNLQAKWQDGVADARLH